MGWEYYNGKPQLYSYPLSGGNYTELNNPHYFTWAMEGLWKSQEYCIKYRNDTDQPIVINKIGIKTCACDSGGESYWAWGHESADMICKGWGATYYSYIRVSNDNETTFESSIVDNADRVVIPTLSGTNMNSPGSSSTSTAVFGYPPYEGDYGLIHRMFNITKCPMILPKGVAYVHFGIDIPDHSPATPQGQYQFILDPSTMEIELDQSTNPYIWKYTDGKWKLVRPFYVYTNGGWKNIEETE